MQYARAQPPVDGRHLLDGHGFSFSDTLFWPSEWRSGMVERDEQGVVDERSLLRRRGGVVDLGRYRPARLRERRAGDLLGRRFFRQRGKATGKQQQAKGPGISHFLLRNGSSAF